MARAVQEDATRAFGNPGDAAIFEARTHNPGLQGLQVSRMIAIYADDTTVDLRVEVTADGFCHWYGVAAHVQEGALEWHANPAGPCQP